MENTRKEFLHNRKIYNLEFKQQCGNCKTVDNLQIHHIVPLALGGTNNTTNMVVVCEMCHGKIHGNTNNKELQRIGIAKAVKLNRFKGRKPIQYPKKWFMYYTLWREGKATAKDTYTILKLKSTTFYTMVKKYESV